jgi:ERCC4-related helicase
MTSAQFSQGDRVEHRRFGNGRVILDEGVTVIVRFDHGIESCEGSALNRTSSLLEFLRSDTWHAPLAVVTKAQALAIESVNDLWGVLSSSRIDLLPHQLWVCRRVLASWPARWLVADDVGLGKTIEAGLVFWPLIAKGKVKRLLIICPASLVEQWQYRLREMFDIRVAIYTTEADRPKTDFFGTHNQVVASLETLRLDRNDRQTRLLESEPWDLVVVDEAHRLNADEKSGPTLGYQLLDRLVAENRVASMLFFTGTPHRGKNFGFLSLLHLLRPEIFDPTKSLREYLPLLGSVMIRNNKQNATDLNGNRLFLSHTVTNSEFRYSPSEQRFYDMLTHFIETGQAYASSLDPTSGKAVQLVLVAMQKLASSSVAAIRRALKRRLGRIVENRKTLGDLEAERAVRTPRLEQMYEELERDWEVEALNELEEKIAELAARLRLMENEEPRLQQLITAADEVGEETKIKRVIEILENEFAEQQVLFFTEYKATQSLLMSALILRFGTGCVTFINGDNRADDVIDAGQTKTITENRENASDAFNAGKVRFLVSTEAGGEGIDLQESCHCMMHVDLPWNPMRLHQRVGRLDRYGQQMKVEVVILRNPTTVEARIWDKLNEKMDQIMLALGHAMDEPEDLLQLVLGMTSPSLWRDLFSGAPNLSGASLNDWFDQKAKTFGGRDVIDTVRELVGNCAKFDFQQVSTQLPRVDLPALRPFFLSMLKLNGRRFDDKDDEGLAFRTPDAWRTEPGIFSAYEQMVFNRSIRSKGAVKRVLGIGHKLVGQALRQAKTNNAHVATLSAKSLKRPVLIFQIADRVTGEEGTVRMVIVGVEIEPEGSGVFLKDWELLERLNDITSGCPVKAKSSLAPKDLEQVETALRANHEVVRERLPELALPFKVPEIEPVAILWPMVRDGGEQVADVEEESEEVADLD